MLSTMQLQVQDSSVAIDAVESAITGSRGHKTLVVVDQLPACPGGPLSPCGPTIP